MKLRIAAALAIVAVFVGVIYFMHEPAPVAAAVAPPGHATPVAAQPVQAARADVTTRSAPEPSARPVANDPRLAALMVTPDNGMIEFVKGANGKVIQEIDNDPNSPGYRKPTREYVYAGERVVGVTSYRYVGKDVEITRASVAYKPDGSVDQYRESTDHAPSGRP